MFRHLLVAALGLGLSVITPVPAAAQSNTGWTVECSDTLRGQGRRAALQRTAEQSAIDAWEGEARRRHGAGTDFDFLAGMAMGRMRMTCRRATGMDVCELSGRACVYRPSQTRSGSIPSRCPRGTTLRPDGTICDHVQLGEYRIRPVNTVLRMTEQICPHGYRLDPADRRRCLPS